MKNIKINKEIEYTKKTYNGKVQVKTYTSRVKLGLWASEKLIFSKYINKKDSILDIGCGAGRTTFALKEMGYSNLIGLDLSNKLISFARKYAKKANIDLDFLQGDASNLSFEDNSFDVCIFSYNGLMCIPNKNIRDKVVKEVYRVLKLNGKFIFTTHDRDDPRYQEYWEKEQLLWENGLQDKTLFEYGDRYYDGDEEGEGFLHIPSREEVETMVKENNMELLYCESTEKIAKEINDKYYSDCLFWVIEKKPLV